MGNSISGAFLGISIDESSGRLYGGSKLRGKIYLDVQSPSITADSLNITFYGREHTTVEYTVHEEDNKTRTEYAHASAHICNIEFILFQFGGSVNKGRYEFPFEFTIPPGIPGKQGSYISGSSYTIDYHLEAKVHRHGMLTWDTKNSVEIFLTDAPYNRIPTPVFITPNTSTIYFLCCIKSGTMTLGAKLDSNNICHNESVRVSYEVRNDSTSRVKALEVRVYEVITFSAGGRSATSKNVLFKQRIEAERLDNITKVDQINNVASSQEIQTMINNLSKSVHFVDAFIPNTARPSFVGVLGRVSHFVEVQIMTPYCVSDPEITYPLIIHSRGDDFTGMVSAVAQPFTLPPDWYAVNASTVNLDPPPVAPQSIADSSSVDYLINLLRNSSAFSEASCLKEWVTYGNVDRISPTDMARIFSTIKAEYSYNEFPNVLGAAMVQPNGVSWLTCRHIKEAAAASPSQQIQTVCTAFAKYCGDKQNASTEFAVLNLPPYNLSAVLLYY
mmetsp:Transcript_7169/g.9925  ORF Transcript_7169/g.9925 Transcript_7169/m.9925 type:complete len:501 (+) Transcript_7169:41-1543(+)